MATLQHLLTWLQGFTPLYITLFQLGAIFVITFIFSMVELVLYRHIYPRLVRTNNLWDDVLICALHAPLQLVIWVVGVTFMVGMLSDLLPKMNLVRLMTLTRDVICVAGIVWFLMRYIKFFEIRLVSPSVAQDKKSIDKAKAFAIGKLLRVAVALIAVLIFLQIVGVPISGLLAFGGAGALVVGLAAKDLLANFFGGLMIYTDRPFTVGDWIRSPDRDVEGTVEHIGWRLTRIRTFNATPLYVPNAIFSSIAIENPSRMHSRRIRTTIGLSYQDLPKLGQILAELNAMLKTHRELDHKQDTYAHFTAFADSSLTLLISVYTKATDTKGFLKTQESILLDIATIIEKYDAQFAYPTQTLHIPSAIGVSVK